MSKHSVLIIGCGSIGERHLRCFQRTGRAEVTICDFRPELAERMSRAYNVPAVTDWEQAVDRGRFDATVICTPAPLHVPMALRSLRAGAHALVEKPLSHSLEEVDTLIAERDRSGRQIAVAYVYAFFPYLAAARAFLQRRPEQVPLLATYVGGQPFHRLRRGYAQTYYRDRRTGGGAIQDALTHIANWMESVLGPTDSVLCDCAHLVVPEVSVEDTVNVVARHGWALVSYSLNQFQNADESTFGFHAAEESVKIEAHRERWGHRSTGEANWTWHETPVADYDTCFVAQAQAFLDRIEGKPAPALCTLEAAVQTLRFNLAALASADAGGARVACASVRA